MSAASPVVVIIDSSNPRVITGTYTFDTGSVLLIPSGSSLPGTPTAKEIFWNTTDDILYRRNDADTAWVAVNATVAAHGSSHENGGGDAIKLDDLAAPDDNTDLDATTSAHGLLRKLNNATTDFLRGDGEWAAPKLPKGYLDGLFVKRNDTNPAYQIDIQSGRCRSADDTTDIVVSSTITVDITASGVNGLDTGSEAADTWYFLWLIYNPTTQTAAGLLSASSTSPTMPSGYTKKRYLAPTYNNSSSDFLKWTLCTHGRDRHYAYFDEDKDNLQLLSGGSSTSFVDLDCSSLVPPTSTIVELYAILFAAASGTHLYVRANGSSVSTPPTMVVAGTLSSGWEDSGTHLLCLTDTSQTIEYQIDSSGESAYIWCFGFREAI